MLRRWRYKIRALTEIPAGRRYRRRFGIAAFTREDFEAMHSDPNCPVRKVQRPITGGREGQQMSEDWAERAAVELKRLRAELDAGRVAAALKRWRAERAEADLDEVRAENKRLIADRAANEKANVASRRSICEQRDRYLAQVQRVEALCDALKAHGVVAVFESAEEIAALISTALDGDPE